MVFQKTETVVCSITVKSSGTLTSPATSMNIIITDPVGTAVVTSTGMANDSTGVYHYDYTPASTVLRGTYRVQYKATDGARITIQEDEFDIE